MEAYGAAQGMEAHSTDAIRKFLVIKGISDYADDKKADTDWREYAAHAAVAYVKSILTTVSIEPTANQKRIPNGLIKASFAEQQNRIGDIQYRQGEYPNAYKHYMEAWRTKDGETDESRRLIITARIAHNLGRTLRFSGEIPDARHFSMISWLLRKKATGNDHDLADSYHLMGLVDREDGNTKIALEHFEKAQSLYEKIPDWAGYSRSMRWRGYTYFSLGEYLEAYTLLWTSHRDLIGRADWERRPDAAESHDMMGRVLREIAVRYKDRIAEYDGVKRNYNLPETPEECRKLSLEYFQQGEYLADRTGDHFKYTESQLSYVIYYFELEDIDSQDWLSRIKKPYELGIKIAESHEYNLLMCLFEKYMGNAYFKKRQYQKAFDHYGKRYIAALKVRQTEQSRTIEEIVTKISELPENIDRRQYLEQLTSFLGRVDI